MKTITIPVDFAGITHNVDLHPADLINQIKDKYSKAVFIETVLDIFSGLDFDGIELEDFQIAILRSRMIKLNGMFKFKSSDLACQFLDWCINNDVDTSLPDFSAKTIFEKFINSRV